MRDFRREAADLKKPAIFLAVGFVLAAVLAGAAFWYAFSAETQEVFAAAVFAEEAETPIIQSAQNSAENSRADLPVIPINWGAGIFFDTYSSKLFFPDGAEFEYNYYRREYTVVFEGADFARRSFPLLPHDTLPMRITREGDSVSVRTRRGVFARRGETYIQFFDPRDYYHTIIVIDAGHGGIDTGAPSALASAPNEAEVVLAISQKLLEIFDKDGVLLIPTRTCDYFLEVAQRARIANAIGDYFISIHNNAEARNTRARGMLTLYGTADGSLELAEKFQPALVDALESLDRGVHYAPQFHILRESRIPVVLLEILFISNPQDAALLADPEIQTLIAETIAETLAQLPPAR